MEARGPKPIIKIKASSSFTLAHVLAALEKEQQKEAPDPEVLALLVRERERLLSTGGGK